MRFEVRALRPGGGVVSETFEAEDEPAALRLATAAGPAVLSARTQRIGGLQWRRASPRFDIVAFSQELVALLGAGLSLPETLEVMIEKDARAERRRVVQTIRDRLYDGLMFSQAVEGLGE